MIVDAAPRLASLQGSRLAFLDCGKRGGDALLRDVADRIAPEGATIAYAAKKSAHRMAPRKLIEALSAEFEGIVYGIVN